MTALLPDALYVYLPQGAAARIPAKTFVRPHIIEKVKAHPPVELDRYQQTSVKKTQTVLYHNGHIAYRTETWYTTGAKQGIAYTYPLTDRRILEFVFQLPDDLFVKHGFKRYFYRKSIAPLFPANTIDVMELNPKAEPEMLRLNRARNMLRARHYVSQEGERQSAEALAVQGDNPWLDYASWLAADSKILAEDRVNVPPPDITEEGLVSRLMGIWAQVKKNRMKRAAQAAEQTQKELV